MMTPQHRPSLRVTAAARTEQGLLLRSEYGSMLLQPVRGDIVRVRFTRQESFGDRHTPGMVWQPEPVDWTWQETDSIVELRTACAALTVDRETFTVSYADAQGHILLREDPARPRELEGYDAFVTDPDAPARVERVQTPDGEKSFVREGGRLFDRRLFRGRVHFLWQEGESLYGLGQHEEGLLDLRGHTVYLHQANLKIAVPVLVSSLGYGILLDTYGPAVFRDDAFSHSLYLEADEEWDQYFLLGGGMDGVVRGVRTLTGRAAVPPKWVFGYFQSQERYESAQELVDTARTFRRLGLGLDCVVLDWNSWEDGYWGQKTLDPARFPDPRAMMDELHALGARLMVSVWSNPSANSPDAKAFAARGWLLPFSDQYNAFLPEARELYWHQTERGLKRFGVDAWWCDASEPLTPEWAHTEKPDPAAQYAEYVAEVQKQIPLRLSNAYCLFHTQAIYEGQRGSDTAHRPVILTRSAYTGAQRYGAVFWSGDTAASWETFRRQIAAGLNFCASGLPYWTCDTGAFFVKRGLPWFWDGQFEEGSESAAYRELYTRWFQYAAFLPLFRAHGTDTRREPWAFGGAGSPWYEAMASISRLRYRLLPLVYSAAGLAWRDGGSLMRMLAFEFPEDARARETADEYLFCGSLLVCPVTAPETELPAETEEDGSAVPCRPVYLPRGRWIDLWTNRVYEGGREILAEAPLSRIPVFVKAGAALPASRSLTRSVPREARPVPVFVYPGASGETLFYEDDGDGFGYESGDYTVTALRWDDSTRTFTAVRGGEDCTSEFEVFVMDGEQPPLPDHDLSSD